MCIVVMSVDWEWVFGDVSSLLWLIIVIVIVSGITIVIITIYSVTASRYITHITITITAVITIYIIVITTDKHTPIPIPTSTNRRQSIPITPQKYLLITRVKLNMIKPILCHSQLRVLRLLVKSWRELLLLT